MAGAAETFATLEFVVAAGIGRITLNRPDAANAISPALGHELYRAALLCDSDPAVRAVILTGAGKMFSAGGDIRSFAAMGEGVGAGLRALTLHLHAAVAVFLRMDAPLVVAVNGTAAGAGFGLMLAGDVVIAAESARFTMAYTAAGLTPDGGSTFLLPRLVGPLRAKELMLLNRRLDAREALAWGLVSEVVGDDQVVARAEAVARTLADGPTGAFGAAKRLLADTFTTPLETQMELESRAIARAAMSADGREGVAAFLAKRQPRFTGT